MMNVFEKTLRDLFEGSKILHDMKFTGKTCIARLDKDLRVKMTIVDKGIIGNFNAITVGIINRTDGLVDAQTFRFRDMVPARTGQNSFGRDYPYICIYNGKEEWYGEPLSPAEQKMVRTAILDYVGMYQDLQMPMSMQSM